MNLASIIAYPMLSFSPLMTSVESMLILGCKIIALQWQSEKQSTIEGSSINEEQAGPTQTIHEEYDMVIMDHPNEMFAEGVT